VSGDRGDDLAGAQQTKRSGVREAPARTPKRASFTRSVKETQPAILGHGKGRFT